MNQQEFIPIDIFCLHHDVEISFISAMHEFGLIEITQINEERYIPISQLMEAEKLVRLHNELEINTEGIDVVSHLLQRIKEMREEMQVLKSRLRLYEEM